MIVAHHYVTNSGLTGVGEPLMTDFSSKSVFLFIFGAWGKTGINCFMMITGYFMCTSKITFRKFLKLLTQIYFYRIFLFALFLSTGYETMSTMRLVKLLMPFWELEHGFISCFMVFFLTIPFWTMLVQNMTKRQHEMLLILLFGCYTLLGSVPTFKVSFNYITWFGVIFLMASYIRLYPVKLFERRALWGWLSLVFVTFASLTIVLLQRYLGAPQFLLLSSSRLFIFIFNFSI